MTVDWKPPLTWKELEAGVLAKYGSFSSMPPAAVLSLGRIKTEILVRQKVSPWMFYRPYESRRKVGWYPQLDFHSSLAKIRMLIGGNRSGKSESGIMEVVWAAQGAHPFIKYPCPCDIWVVSLTNQMSLEVAEQKIFRWISRMDIKRWDKQYKVLSLKNGSHIGFKSCEQDINTFGGSAKDLILFDEEPPGERGYQIYKECLMRTADRAGRICFTMTPVQGMSWTADEIYEPARNGNPDIFAVEVSTYDNPHISQDELGIIEKQYTEDEKEMRLYGKYIQFAGLVYKEFDRDVHIVSPFAIPTHWKRFRSIDHGINNPTACVWMAVNEKDEMYIYDEYYETDKTIKENADAIKAITGGDRIYWTTIDPSTDNRDPISNTSIRQEYYKQGITTKALRTDKHEGIDRVKQAFKFDPSLPLGELNKPRLYVFNNCHAVLKELSRYRWKVYRGKEDRNAIEEPQKVFDHAMDALRYLIMSRPRYKLDEESELQPVPNWYEVR